MNLSELQISESAIRGAQLGWRKVAGSWALSVAVHASVAAALCWTVLPVIERVRLAGSRTVISVASMPSPAAPPAEQPITVPDIEPRPRLTETPGQLHPEPNELDRQQPPPPGLAAAEIPLPKFESREAPARRPKRAQPAEATQPLRTAPQPVKTARRPVPRPTIPSPSVAVPQTAGIDETAARAVSTPRYYPIEAVARRIEGRVVLRISVRADGRVVEVSVAESSGHAILDRAALDAARQWRYAPARRDGEPVDSVVRQPMRFRL